jgi:sialate O-acetylesterase
MRKFLFAFLTGATLCWLASPAAQADVTPHALFGDGMVVQRDMPIVVWGKADPGEKVEVAFNFKGGVEADRKGEATADKDGKWQVTLEKVVLTTPAPADSKPAKGTLTINGKNKIAINDVYLGDVWVCSGQSNMEMHLDSCNHAKEDKAAAANSNIRLFTVPKQAAEEPKTEFAETKNKLESKWLECGPETVGSFSAVGYYFGRDVQKAERIPIGLIHSSWGGTIAEAWATRASLEGNPDLKAMVANPLNSEPRNPNRATVLYNGMICPLQPFPIKGAIWYQGESNAGRAYQYRTLFPTMIQSWRDSWKQPDLPFYFVQLAPWDPRYDPMVKQPADSAWAELREAQLLTSEKPHTGMAVITDTVPAAQAKDIHPKEKEPVGARLALCARALAYHDKVEYSGPLYDKMTIDGNKAILTFTHVSKGLEAKGLDSKGDALEGFTVAGEDKQFHDAKAEIKGDKVVVTCDKVEKPVAVRFGWTNFPIMNLFNKDGLPATPFRTDDFPMVTGPKK